MVNNGHTIQVDVLPDPGTEGVLWLVLKQPVTVSPGQLKLFGQLFPHNARPVQPVHDRPVRDAQ